MNFNFGNFQSTSSGGGLLFPSTTSSSNSTTTPSLNLFAPYSSTRPISLFGSTNPPTSQSSIFSTKQTEISTLFPVSQSTETSSSNNPNVGQPFQSSILKSSTLNLFGHHADKDKIPSSSLFLPTAAKTEEPIVEKQPLAVSPPKRVAVKKPKSITSPIPKERVFAKGDTSSATSSAITMSSIKVLYIPTEAFSPAFLRKHFSKFGKIKSISCNRKDQSAIVRFEEDGVAMKAKQSGSQLVENSPPVSIEIIKRRVSANNAGSSTPSTSQPAPIKEIKSSAIFSRDKRQCTTIAERLALLEKRDKILRQTKRKGGTGDSIHHSTDLNRSMSKVAVLIGTGQDMCSEKERYSRLEQNRTSIYECNAANEFDHSLAVTEYSRSSADQEEPLSHDLRTPEVLLRTMNYLLAAVANRASTQPSESMRWGRWYEFLWNRTRAMRKEITQQRLTEEVGIELIEKTARFHIYSAERLCEEEADAFDHKINNENLNQCLQSLRELYHDANAKGVHSPNEPEFRAYMILMKLTDSNILSEVQRLSSSMRNDSRVQDAMSAYYAVYNNNYIRFFKTVQKTTFFNACLLHRYFFQVRSKALNVIAHAFAASKSRLFVEVTQSYLMNSLRMESEAEVRALCTHLGYRIHADKVHLMQSPNILDDHYKSPRAIKLAESKIMGHQVGEILNNGPLKPASDYVQPPHFSFDAAGNYIAAWPNEVVSADNWVGTAAPPPALALAQPPPPPPQFSSYVASEVKSSSDSQPYDMSCYRMEFKFLICSAIMDEVIQEEVMEICDSLGCQHNASLQIVNELVENVIVHESHSVATSVRLSEQRQCSLASDLLEQLMGDEIAFQCNTFLTDSRLSQADVTQEMSSEVLQQCVTEVVSSELRQIAEQSVHTLHKMLKEADSLSESILQQALSEEIDFLLKTERLQYTKKRNLFRKWHYWSQTKLFDRQVLLYLPPCPIIQDNFTTLEKFQSHLRVVPTKAKLSRKCLEADDTESMRPFAFSSTASLPDLYLVIGCPTVCSKNAHFNSRVDVIVKWILHKLREYPNSRIFIKKFHSGVDCANYLNKMTQQLCLLLLSEDIYLQLSGFWSESWIHIICPQLLKSTSLLESSNANVVELHGMTVCGQWSVRLEDKLLTALQCVIRAATADTIPSPATKKNAWISLGEILHKWMLSRYFEPAFVDKARREEFDYVDQHPHDLIHAFNCSVNYLFQQLMELPTTNWHSPPPREFLRQSWQSLLSPDFPLSPRNTLQSWSCATSAWESYIASISQSHGFQPWPVVLRQCEQALNTVRGSFSLAYQQNGFHPPAKHTTEEQREEELMPYFENAPWTDLVTSVLFNRLHQWNIGLDSRAPIGCPLLSESVWQQLSTDEWICSFPAAIVGVTVTHTKCQKAAYVDSCKAAWNSTVQSSRMDQSLAQPGRDNFSSMYLKIQGQLQRLKSDITVLSTSFQENSIT